MGVRNRVANEVAIVLYLSITSLASLDEPDCAID